MEIEMNEEQFMSIFKAAYEYLDAMNIYEVRNIARAYGFGAPTTERKDILIRNIISIASGFVQPKPRSNRGPRVKAESPSDQSIAQIQKIVDDCKMKMPYLTKREESERIIFHDVAEGKKEYGYGDELFIGVLEDCGNGEWQLCPENTDTITTVPKISNEIVKQFNFREGDLISGYIEYYEDGHSEIACAAAREGTLPIYSDRKQFEGFAALFPNEKYSFAQSKYPAVRAMDSLCPIGKGQRVALIAPSASGKTMFLNEVASCLEKQSQVIVLLLGQRPEESEEIRSANQNSIVFSAPFDCDFEQRMRFTHLAFERAKRLCESKKDVVLLVDSFETMISVAAEYNHGMQSAINESKHIFASAHRLENGGSLTVISVLPETNRAISYDCNEFVQAANSVLYFTNDVAKQGIYPAIDFTRSYTRRSAELLNEKELAFAEKLRAVAMENGTQGVIQSLKNSEENRNE